MLALLHLVDDAGGKMALKQLIFNACKRPLHCRGLRNDVYAVRIFLHHLLEAANLAFNPTKSVLNLLLCIEFHMPSIPPGGILSTGAHAVRLMHMNHSKHYGRLALMFVLHLIAMYILMYAMVDSTANVHHSYNQFYMAMLMASPMLVLELLLMSSMYPNKKLNGGIIAAGLLLLVGSFFFIRQQVAIADEQFLRSMIPHHAGAVLMCEKAHLKDAQVSELCGNILTGQKAEIEWMNAKLESL